MPLLHEIKDPDNENILCFVPSGHLTSTGFVDFPVPTTTEGLHNIWYYVNRWLASLKHTQSPFNENEYAEAETYLSHLKEKLDSIERIRNRCLRILYKLFTENKSDINQKSTITFADLLPYMSQDDLEEATPKENLLGVDVATNDEIFSQMIVEMSNLIISNINNINVSDYIEFHVTASKLCLPSLAARMESVRKSYLLIMPLNDVIEKNGIKLDSSQREKIDLRLLQSVTLKLNQATIEISQDTETNYKSWKSFFITMLLNNGPFSVAGHVGSDFYPRTKPQSCGQLGSIQLLGFPPNTYDQHSISGYGVVIVIGINKDKIIYLDSRLGSHMSGPRQAFVMDIKKFMDRIVPINKALYNKLIFTTVRQGEIDTTIELMAEHTKMDLPNELYVFTHNANRTIDFNIIPKIRVHEQKAAIQYSVDEHAYSSIKINNIEVFREKYFRDQAKETYPVPLVELLADGSFVKHDSTEHLPLDDISCFEGKFSETLSFQMFGNNRAVSFFIGCISKFRKMADYLISNACDYAELNNMLELHTVKRPMILFSKDQRGVLKPVNVLPNILSRSVLDEMVAVNNGKKIVIDRNIAIPGEKQDNDVGPSQRLRMERIQTSWRGTFDRSPERLAILKGRLNSGASSPQWVSEESNREFVIIDENNVEKFKITVREAICPTAILLHPGVYSSLSTKFMITFSNPDRAVAENEFNRFVSSIKQADASYGCYTNSNYTFYNDFTFDIWLTKLCETQLAEFFDVLKRQPEFSFDGAEIFIQQLMAWTHPKFLSDPVYDNIKILIDDKEYDKALEKAYEEDCQLAKKDQLIQDYSYKYIYLVANLLFKNPEAQHVSMQAFNYLRRFSGRYDIESHEKSSQIAIALSGHGYNKELYLDTIRTCLFSAGSKPGGERRTVISLITKLSGDRDDVKDNLSRLQLKDFVANGETEQTSLETFATDVIDSLTSALRSRSINTSSKIGRRRYNSV